VAEQKERDSLAAQKTPSQKSRAMAAFERQAERTGAGPAAGHGASPGSGERRGSAAELAVHSGSLAATKAALLARGEAAEAPRASQKEEARSGPGH
jgi:hypothetical protein